MFLRTCVLYFALAITFNSGFGLSDAEKRVKRATLIESYPELTDLESSEENSDISLPVAAEEIVLSDSEILNQSDEFELVLKKGFNPHVILGDYSYYVGVYEQVSWYRALQECALQNMQLLYIDNAQNNRQLRNFLTEQNILPAQYWTSANNFIQDDEFVWLPTGKDLTFTNWGQNETGPFSNCVYINKNYKWGVTDCYDDHYFICKAPLVPRCGPTGQCHS
ncbi:uncharacterized protein LOC119677996 [Teleopsis dalmanni]|uniref:uncharacterized protein LOC119677996 n=1 Tax=Teleopsis dalmanni TaxID=139649 RepID=UPI0018CE5A05|nr:uncharacterized protein LOC119677996 [Teleopsis dalmanni]